MIGSRREGGALIRRLRTLYNLGTLRDLTDGQLLERFATDAGEAAELAFAALVERHQEMVWRVCLAITRDGHAAEDAIQATFLVLARRGRSLWVRDSLGPWLHQVACRTASCLRAKMVRRSRHERRCAAMQAGRVAIGTADDSDRDAAIHEEVEGLPEKYRAPVVLCDLEGRTHREAARCLGWPIGTVKSRQMQARRLLRDRLAARGLGPAVAPAAVGSLRPTAAAAIPPEIARITSAAAMQQSARLPTAAVVSAPVITLTREVIRAMVWSRIRSVAVIVVTAGIASGGAGIYVAGSQGPAKDAKPAAAQPSRPPESAEWRAQRLATRKAQATYEIARLHRELAEIALEEYQDVTYPRDLAAVSSEIKRAQSDLVRAEDRLEWAKRMYEKGYVSKATLVSAELDFDKAKLALEQAQARKKVLELYTREKTIKELQGRVKKARVEELDREAAWDREKTREAELAAGTNRGSQ